MIVINVKAHSPFDRLLGEREMSVTLPRGATGRQLLSQLGLYVREREEEDWDDDRLRSNLYMLRHDRLLKLDNELQDGDEIALLPPISGGSGDACTDGQPLPHGSPVYLQFIFSPRASPKKFKCYGPEPAFPIPPPRETKTADHFPS